MLCSGCSHLRFAIFTPSISHDRSTKQEKTMTNIFISSKTVALAAVVAFGAIAFSSLSANASSPSGLSQCKAYSKEKVVKCCETVIKQRGAPRWFLENNSSCSSAATCTSGGISLTHGETRRCYIRPELDNNQGKGHEPEGKTRGTQGQ